METILCAAIWYKDQPNAIHGPKNIPCGVVLCGHRHHAIIDQCSTLLNKRQSEMGMSIQGFLTSRNRFVDRAEAGRIAIAAGQIQQLEYHETDLFSEDLY